MRLALLLAAAGAEILAAQADAVLLRVRAGKTERQSAHYAIQQLRAIGGLEGQCRETSAECQAGQRRHGG